MSQLTYFIKAYRVKDGLIVKCFVDIKGLDTAVELYTQTLAHLRAIGYLNTHRITLYEESADYTHELMSTTVNDAIERKDTYAILDNRTLGTFSTTTSIMGLQRSLMSLGVNRYHYSVVTLDSNLNVTINLKKPCQFA